MFYLHLASWYVAWIQEFQMNLWNFYEILLFTNPALYNFYLLSSGSSSVCSMYTREKMSSEMFVAEFFLPDQHCTIFFFNTESNPLHLQDISYVGGENSDFNFTWKNESNEILNRKILNYNKISLFIRLANKKIN